MISMKKSTLPQIVAFAAAAVLTLSGCISVKREDRGAASSTTTTRTSTVVPTAGSTTVERTTVY